MKAVAKTRPAPGIELVDVPEPVIVEDDDVLVEVAACGICGSDVQTYLWSDDVRPAHLPVVLGHEFSGTVTEVGPKVTQFRVGDRVVAESLARCGQCHACQLGAFNRCEKAERLGHTVNGGLARSVAVPCTSLFQVPDEVPFEHAAVLKPLGVALHAFERSGWLPGGSVAVIGPGTVGILAGMIARAAGAAEVILIGLDRDRRRLELAASLGMTVIRSDAKATNVERAVHTRTDGRGVHLAIEASGDPTSLGQAITLTRPGGVVAAAGISRGAQVNAADIVMKELTVTGVLTRLPSTWHRAIDMVKSRAIDVSPLITAVLPLSHTEQGFQALLAREAVKIVIDPRSGAPDGAKACQAPSPTDYQ